MGYIITLLIKDRRLIARVSRFTLFGYPGIRRVKTSANDYGNVSLFVIEVKKVSGDRAQGFRAVLEILRSII